MTLLANPKLIHRGLTDRVLKCAFKVHSALGPGLLEGAYRDCLAWELNREGIQVAREVQIPLIYEGVRIDWGYRADLLIEDVALVEVKSVERLLPIHTAQLITYLKLSKRGVGLLLNFNSVHLRDGLRRITR